jgi:hypothetical protein
VTPASRWLRARLAELPTAVESLSVMAVFSDVNDVPRIDPAIKATLRGADGAQCQWSSLGLNFTPPSCEGGADALDALADNLTEAIDGLTYLLPVDEWQTETR